MKEYHLWINDTSQPTRLTLTVSGGELRHKLEVRESGWQGQWVEHYMNQDDLQEVLDSLIAQLRDR